ncbi:MAG: hypothetical protein A2600_08085 [Candidatus Lambdaproteobacteria bacterium RIFOXYD1_FULL_56_27]|uniref:Uncharacterized protein n=1 Tax=Candidatus Lambdaproteobacteria bacterium RIFOXYD2_FULL_56_26 TaxID=1817773 RepID=A0A1F6GVJ5_9PROT|nr:MAG: hypothetical protein A2557_05210 [Candidatus Lambdaproteobacteria bacterium RIFOXYD2_FULL_56_26]OGH03269.1 MAG: hypothetical protein A2426_06880 [Candidatus Lambdaproteobacteria bacterium RIFOXYC1_FULL_56_13]OGH07467.1 MAG: hypothetical protein A2600_08085 [Candidatus Lambdaproteobacteria bacterium RIFOXYD1_FULL_56_27]
MSVLPLGFLSFICLAHQTKAARLRFGSVLAYRFFLPWAKLGPNPFSYGHKWHSLFSKLR